MWVKLVSTPAIPRRELKAWSNEYFHCLSKIKLTFITASFICILNTRHGKIFEIMNN